jgi:hypothetical protein
LADPVDEIRTVHPPDCSFASEPKFAPWYQSSQKYRTTAFCRNRSRDKAFDHARQRCKVHHLTYLDQWVTYAVDSSGPRISNHQISFDCATWIHYSTTRSTELSRHFTRC